MAGGVGSSNSYNLGAVYQQTTTRKEVLETGRYNDGNIQFNPGSRIKNEGQFSTGVSQDHDDNIMMTQWGNDTAVKEINGALNKQKGEVFLEVITGPDVGGKGMDNVGIIKFDLSKPADVARLKQIAQMLESAPNFQHLELKQGYLTNQDGQEFAQLPKDGGTYQKHNASLILANNP